MAGAGASGSRLRGVAALLPWDDPAPCKWGVRVGVTSRHLSAAVLYWTGLLLGVELFFLLLFPFFVISYLLMALCRERGFRWLREVDYL